ncbi:HEXXH motif domain-containing protein [Sphaerisporangium sp. TRM90804]|uniref:HEXXH motif domain-containing protein n=1 Tax=Sphaerisporangium sp. TRM90804 TaxID=3031113 RepID=UPI00244B5612|nr:HEXXH motif domain-containing protein [Sphaerisporangium sp. TRM90804]MDH2427495.1 HEXXH motif domain-containing protein [Sphaerisporangium sp. TRM90804]
MSGRPGRLLMPPEMFEALARGGGGAAAGRWLAAAEKGKHLLLVRAAVEAVTAGGHPSTGPVRGAYRLLTDLQGRAPRTVDDVLAHPATGGWALDTVRRMARGEPAAPERLACVAAAVAIRERIPRTVAVPMERRGGLGTLMLPSVGRAFFDAPEPGSPPGDATCLVRVHATGAEIVGPRSTVTVPRDHTRDGDAWQGMRRLSATAEGVPFQVLVDDLDEHRFPPEAPLAPRLDGAEAAHWQAVFQEAWKLLVLRHRAVAEEVRTMTTVLTPLRGGAAGGSSATSRETFGCVATSRPPDATALALTFAHEIQHAKLAAILDLVDLIEPPAPGAETLFYAPWREDPRPIGGLLHGAYAHLGVAAFWRRQRHHDDEPGLASHVEFTRWRDATAQTVEVLAGSDRFNRLGLGFLAGMRSALGEWRDDAVPAAAVASARAAAETHRARWSDAR